MHPSLFFGALKNQDSEERTILHYACEYNSSRVVKTIFDLLFEETLDEDLKLKVSRDSSIKSEQEPRAKQAFINL